MKKLTNIWQENRKLILFISLMFVFRSAIADWNDVPTGSMQPTIEIGDRIYVDKMAYDIRVPFTQISLRKLADPIKGDIIIFESAVTDNRLVKRVIGEPGDTIAMQNNRLIINGKPIAYDAQKSTNDYVELIENLNGVKHKIRISHSSYAGSFNEVKVPAEHYLVLGDNRDNSADSRVIGFVPRHEIIGKSDSVVISLDYDNYFLPRSDRVITPLDSI